MTVFDKLDKAKRQLSEIEATKNVLKGKIESAEEELAKLGYDSVGEAEKNLVEIDKAISEMENSLEEMINEFESKYAELLAAND